MDELRGVDEMSIRENPLDNPQDLVLNFHCKKPSFSLSQAINIMPYRRRLSIENLPFRGSSGIGRVESGETNVNCVPKPVTEALKRSVSFGPKKGYSTESAQLNDVSPTRGSTISSHPGIWTTQTGDKMIVNMGATATVLDPDQPISQVALENQTGTPWFGRPRSLFG